MSQNVIQIIITGKDLSGEALKKTNASLDRMGVNLQKIGKAGMMVGGAITIPMVAAAKSAANLEEGVRRIIGAQERTTAEYDALYKRLTEHVQQLSIRTGQSAVDIAASLRFVVGMGVEPTDKAFYELSQTIVDFAKVADIDVQTSIGALAETMQQFNLPMSEANAVAGMFAATARMMDEPLVNIIEAMRGAGGAAAAMGVDMETTTAMVLALMHAGQPAGRAGMAIKQLFVALVGAGDASSESGKELKRLGIEIFDSSGKARDFLIVLDELRAAMAGMTDQERSSTLQKIAGARAFARLGDLVRTSGKEMLDWRDGMSDADAMEKALNWRMGATNEQFRRMTRQLQGAQQAIGGALLGDTRSFTVLIGAAADKVHEFADAHENLTRVIAGAGGFIGVASMLTFSIGTLVRLFAYARIGILAFNATLVRIPGPVGIIAGAIMILAPLIYELTKGVRGLGAEADVLGKKKIDLGVKLPDESALKELAERDKQLRASMVGGATSFEQILANWQKGVRDAELATIPLSKQLKDVLDAMKAVNEVQILSEGEAELWHTALTESPKLAEYIDHLAATLPLPPFASPLAMQNLEHAVELIQRIPTGGFWNVAPRFSPEALETMATSVKTQLEHNLELMDIEIPMPDLIIMSDQELGRIKKFTSVLEGSFNSAFQRILVKGNKWRDSILAMVNSLVSGMIAELARLAAVRMASAFFPFLGGLFNFFSGLGGGGFEAGPAVAQYGGTIPGFYGGRDNVPILASSGENILDRALNKRLASFLDRAEQGGGIGPVHISYNSMLSTATEGDRITHARAVRRDLDRSISGRVARGGW